MRAEREALARNMCAPPSTTLTFSPLVPETGGSGDAIADGAGLSLVCRLDFRRLLPKQIRLNGSRRGIPGTLGPEDSLRMTYPHARAEADGRKRPARAAYVRARTAPVEELADELRDIATAVPLAAAGLPAFGMLLGTQDGDRAVEPSLCRTIAILARRRGTVFLRDCDPVVWSALDGRALDLWVPVAAPGRRA